MRLKSPTNNPISFGDAVGSGHCMVLGPDGEDVPQMFIQSAFAAGAVPADADADEAIDLLSLDYHALLDEVDLSTHPPYLLFILFLIKSVPVIVQR